MTVALAAAVVLALVNLALVALMLIHRPLRRRVERVRRSRRSRLRHRVLADLCDGQPVEGPLTGADRRELARLAVDLSDRISGDMRHDLAHLLSEHGFLGDALRAVRARGMERRARALHLLGVLAPVAPEVRLEAEAHLNDVAPIVRAVAVRTLGRCGDPAAAPALIASLDGPRPTPPGRVAWALSEMGPAVVQPLGRCLATAGRRGRAVAADLLGQLGAVAAVPDLVRVMGEDPDTAVRTSCARALGLVGSPQARSALVDALDGRQEPALRVGAAGALGGLGDPGAFGALGASLQGDHDAVAAASAHALARCGDAGLACLRSVAAGSGRSADHAAEALGAHALDEGRPSGLVPA